MRKREAKEKGVVTFNIFDTKADESKLVGIVESLPELSVGEKSEKLSVPKAIIRGVYGVNITSKPGFYDNLRIVGNQIWIIRGGTSRKHVAARCVRKALKEKGIAYRRGYVDMNRGEANEYNAVPVELTDIREVFVG